VAVIVDAGDPAGAVLSFQAYLRPTRPESNFVFQHLDTSQARFQPRAAAQYAGRGLGVRFQIPLALFGRPAKDAIVRAWNDVRYAFAVLFVQYETLQSRVAYAHDLAPDRLHRSVVYQVSGSEPDAVDDHARIYFVE